MDCLNCKLKNVCCKMDPRRERCTRKCIDCQFSKYRINDFIMCDFCKSEVPVSVYCYFGLKSTQNNLKEILSPTFE